MNPLIFLRKNVSFPFGGCGNKNRMGKCDDVDDMDDPNRDKHEVGQIITIVN